ncbi:hypothetical protein P0J73_001825, partial [Campylobacter jejuni]|nr:hypothetical protein [Campylobacter jejuni]
MDKVLDFLQKLKDWQNNFKIENYNYNNYECEIADFFKFSITKQKY